MISAFRHPNKSGAFDKNSEMIKSRKLILQSILEYSSYTRVKIGDINYPLSDETKLQIVNIMKETMKKV